MSSTLHVWWNRSFTWIYPLYSSSYTKPWKNSGYLWSSGGCSASTMFMLSDPVSVAEQRGIPADPCCLCSWQGSLLARSGDPPKHLLEMFPGSPKAGLSHNNTASLWSYPNVHWSLLLLTMKTPATTVFIHRSNYFTPLRNAIGDILFATPLQSTLAWLTLATARQPYQGKPFFTFQSLKKRGKRINEWESPWNLTFALSEIHHGFFMSIHPDFSFKGRVMQIPLMTSFWLPSTVTINRLVIRNVPWTYLAFQSLF